MGLFKRKQQLRKTMQNNLLSVLNTSRESWLRKKKVIEGSIEPSEEVLQQLKIAEAKYLFLLKEARFHNFSIQSKPIK